MPERVVEPTAGRPAGAVLDGGDQVAVGADGGHRVAPVGRVVRWVVGRVVRWVVWQVVEG